tara:strand:+ start:325 stop:501 length:177 start_codon:yes stop_codon:yes gene_type:complete
MVIIKYVRSITEIELKKSLSRSDINYFPNGLIKIIKEGSKVNTEIIAKSIARPVKIPK